MPNLVCLSNLLKMPEGQDIIVFSKTAKYRHESIESGKEALQKMAEQQGWSIFFSENASIFTPESLQGVKTVVFSKYNWQYIELYARKTL